MKTKVYTMVFVWLLAALILTACQPTAPANAPSGTSAPASSQPAVSQQPSAPLTKYKEAPALAELVKAGKLPPVEDRISKNPMVVKPLQEVGQYGGTWRVTWRGPSDFHSYGRLNYEPVLRWPRVDAKDQVVGPGLAYKWEFSNADKDLTLFFREGLRWSDGEKWTVDDMIFWWEAIETDPKVSAAIRSDWVVNGKPMQLEKINDYTIKLKFDAPNGLLLRFLAFHGNQWPLNFERFGVFAPAHYLKQFHPKYNPQADYKTFIDKADDYNPDRPVMTPWKIINYKGGDPKITAVRNPYYWKVDTEGNQLPYIDQLELTLVENTEAANAKALACEVDMQFRDLELKKVSLFKENEKKCDYRVMLWSSASSANLALWTNQTYPDDPVLRDIFRNKDFRAGLSMAINRSQINKIAFLEQGIINAEPVVPESPYFIPEISSMNMEYNVAKANEYLDKAGLKMGPDKIRLRPDGKPLEITIETQETGAMLDAIQLVAENWNAVGVKAVAKSLNRDLFFTRFTGNQVQVPTWSTDRGYEPLVDPIFLLPFDERSRMATAFGVYYKTGGKQGEAPSGKFLEAQKIYDQIKLTTDPAKQVDLAKQLVRMATEETWTIPTVGSLPSPVVVKNNMRNVPEKATTDWIYMSPGYLDPFQFYYKTK